MKSPEKNADNSEFFQGTANVTTNAWTDMTKREREIQCKQESSIALILKVWSVYLIISDLIKNKNINK